MELLKVGTFTPELSEVLMKDPFVSAELKRLFKEEARGFAELTRILVAKQDLVQQAEQKRYIICAVRAVSDAFIMEAIFSKGNINDINGTAVVFTATVFFINRLLFFLMNAEKMEKFQNRYYEFK